MFKLDVHMHSTLSYDGGITMQDIEKVLESKTLDYIAISDHYEIDFAIAANKAFGDRVIIAEEVKTTGGDLITLFVKERIPSSLSLSDTLKIIKQQDALAYVPHPFEIMRSGISQNELEKVVNEIDIIEVFNARYIFPGGNKRVLNFAKRNNLVMAVGSDAHRANELGTTYNLIGEKPTRDNLVGLLQKAEYVKKYVKPMNYLNPKINLISKRYAK